MRFGSRAYPPLLAQTEHHDFPDVPAFRLRALRDAAPSFYGEPALVGARDGWVETMRRTFAARQFYACSGPEIDPPDEGHEAGFGATL